MPLSQKELFQEGKLISHANALQKEQQQPGGGRPMLSIIPHIQQAAAWDCGLACVCMVLAGLGTRHAALETLHAVYPVSSLWTIDLAFLLRHFGVSDFTMYTSYIGVNWQNADKEFYRDSIADDVKRVHSLFARARDTGVRVVPLAVSLDALRQFLISNRFAAIVLVNLDLLVCRTCRKNQAKDRKSPCSFLSCFQKRQHSHAAASDPLPPSSLSSSTIAIAAAAVAPDTITPPSRTSSSATIVSSAPLWSLVRYFGFARTDRRQDDDSMCSGSHLDDPSQPLLNAHHDSAKPPIHLGPSAAATPPMPQPQPQPPPALSGAPSGSRTSLLSINISLFPTGPTAVSAAGASATATAHASHKSPMPTHDTTHQHQPGHHLATTTVIAASTSSSSSSFFSTSLASAASVTAPSLLAAFSYRASNTSTVAISSSAVASMLSSNDSNTATAAATAASASNGNGSSSGNTNKLVSYGTMLNTQLKPTSSSTITTALPGSAPGSSSASVSSSPRPAIPVTPVRSTTYYHQQQQQLVPTPSRRTTAPPSTPASASPAKQRQSPRLSNASLAGGVGPSSTGYGSNHSSSNPSANVFYNPQPSKQPQHYEHEYQALIHKRRMQVQQKQQQQQQQIQQQQLQRFQQQQQQQQQQQMHDSRTSVNGSIPSTSDCLCCLAPLFHFSKRGYEILYEPEFVGHYIVLIGYNADKDVFLYRDPGTSDTLCEISSRDLEKARSCSGTDHDLIVVRLM